MNDEIFTISLRFIDAEALISFASKASGQSGFGEMRSYSSVPASQSKR